MGTTLYPFNPSYMLNTCILSLIFGYIASLFRWISIVGTCHHLRKTLSMIRLNVALLCMQISREKKREVFDLQQRSHCRRFLAMKTNSRVKCFIDIVPKWWLLVTRANCLHYRIHLESFIVHETLCLSSVRNFMFRVIFISKLNCCLAIITDYLLYYISETCIL